MTLSGQVDRWATRVLRRGGGRRRGPASFRLGDSSGITRVVWALEDFSGVAVTGAGKSRPGGSPRSEAPAGRGARERSIRIITDEPAQVGS